MAAITSKPDWGVSLIVQEGAVARAEDVLQLYFDDIEQRLNDNLLGAQVQLTSYTVATLPDASNAGGMIFVSDETGGTVPAFSDGSDWRRMTDRAVVS